MIKLAYCDVENLDLNKAYRALPEYRKNKMDHFRFDRDKKTECRGISSFKKNVVRAGHHRL
jgi:4'-phosphopantetheinyl transferase